MVDISTVIITLLVLAAAFIGFVLLIRRAGRAPAQPVQPQPPAPAPAAGVPAVPAAVPAGNNTQGRGFLFWILFAIGIACISAALYSVEEFRTGAITIGELWFSQAALLLGTILVIVAVWLLNLGGSTWPRQKIWGTIFAIAAAILLSIVAWKLFLASWWNNAVTWFNSINLPSFSLPHGWQNDWTLVFNTWWMDWVWAILAIILLIGIFKLLFSAGGRKFIGTAAIVLIASLILFAMLKYAIANTPKHSVVEKKQEVRKSVITRVILSPETPTEVQWPDEFRSMSFVEFANGVSPTDLVCFQQTRKPRKGDPYTTVPKGAPLTLKTSNKPIWFAAGEAVTVELVYWK